MADSIKVTKGNTRKGTKVTFVKTDKFKTNSINLFIHNQLDRSTATENAIVPMILKRGSSKYPSMQEISRELESLYGSFFDCGIVKKGERQLQHFYIDCVNDKYIPSKNGLIDECGKLLLGIATDPYLEQGAFKQDYLKQEKENLIRAIQARKNDKVKYAVERCYELMCAKERYGVSELGYIEDIEGLDAKDLYQTYSNNLKNHKVEMLVLGDIEQSWLEKLDEIVSINLDNSPIMEKETIVSHVDEVRDFIDEMDVNQGKLSMGFRTGIGPEHQDYYNLMVCNGVFGGGVHSKLFQNVREKNSLAYYAYSRLDKFKGTMMVSSGIEAVNREKAQGIILEQLEDVRAGKISDFEFDSTIKALRNAIVNTSDDPMQLIDFYLGQSLLGTNESFEEMIRKIENVKREDVARVANQIMLDTVHFIKPRE